MEIHLNNIQICELLETKTIGKVTSKERNYLLIHSGRDKRDYASCGVGFLLHTRLRTSNILTTEY